MRFACNINDSSVIEYLITDISNSSISKYYIVKKTYSISDSDISK